MVWYFQKDNVGVVSNLHLEYCDSKGKYGPNYNESHELAHMCNIAIDFAKHGSKYVDGASLKQYKD